MEHVGTILIAPDTEFLNMNNYFPANMTNIYHHLINRNQLEKLEAAKAA